MLQYYDDIKIGRKLPGFFSKLKRLNQTGIKFIKSSLKDNLIIQNKHIPNLCDKLICCSKIVLFFNKTQPISA